jgi:hypothetical protein
MQKYIESVYKDFTSTKQNLYGFGLALTESNTEKPKHFNLDLFIDIPS